MWRAATEEQAIAERRDQLEPPRSIFRPLTPAAEISAHPAPQPAVTQEIRQPSAAPGVGTPRIQPLPRAPPAMSVLSQMVKPVAVLAEQSPQGDLGRLGVRAATAPAAPRPPRRARPQALMPQPTPLVGREVDQIATSVQQTELTAAMALLRLQQPGHPASPQPHRLKEAPAERLAEPAKQRATEEPP